MLELTDEQKAEFSTERFIEEWLAKAEEQGHIRDPEVKVLPDAEMPEERTYTLKGQFGDD